jgi:hypothetical protein
VSGCASALSVSTVISSSDAKTRSAREKSWCRVNRFGTAMHVRPAAFAASMPDCESSTAAHRRGATPRREAASR